MSFTSVMTTNDTLTENGMPTNSTSSDALVDLFFKSGGARKLDEQAILALFKAALNESPEWAMKCLFYVRDIRGGMGERRFFRTCFKWLAENRPRMAAKVMHLVPEFGRWDDLEVTLDTEVAIDALNFWALAIVTDTENGNKHSLAAKWFPRKGEWFGFARRTMGADARDLRKAVVNISTTVEQLMSKNNWGMVDYEHLPSRALHMYRKAFSKHDETRYTEYQNAVQRGEKKMNAKTLFPSDVVTAVRADYSRCEVKANENAWANLADIGLNNQYILPICDVSGSMEGEPMSVSVALGIYLSERNVGPFKDFIITFSDRPSFLQLSGSLYDKVKQVLSAEWGMSTDLEKTFEMILDKARKGNVPASEMPTKILIISDMQFNQATRMPSANALEMIKREYQASGYEMPLIVFWNVRSSEGIPAKWDSRGVNLVSGYSPSIMKNILKGATRPIDLVIDTLSNPRYDVVTI